MARATRHWLRAPAQSSPDETGSRRRFTATDRPIACGRDVHRQDSVLHPADYKGPDRIMARDSDLACAIAQHTVFVSPKDLEPRLPQGVGRVQVVDAKNSWHGYTCTSTSPTSASRKRSSRPRRQPRYWPAPLSLCHSQATSGAVTGWRHQYLRRCGTPHDSKDVEG